MEPQANDISCPVNSVENACLITESPRFPDDYNLRYCRNTTLSLWRTSQNRDVANLVSEGGVSLRLIYCGNSKEALQLPPRRKLPAWNKGASDYSRSLPTTGLSHRNSSVEYCDLRAIID
jgi:hypothetical protein